MSSQALRDARRYEEIYEKEILTEQRPLFHLAPRCGWMNDPNGFGFYNGSCHLFYQYYPYASEWRSMHWGHATSRDFLHWDYLPAALAPDQSYDYMGCFSGSAIESDDGKHVLMYTSVKMAPEMQDEGIGIQTQSIAIGDGIDYEKYSGNPVLTEEDLPEGGSRYDFRDPKVWKAADGSYICAVANRAADNTGAILLYKSTDLFHWKYWKVLAANHGRFGAMWECPDFFELDGKHVLLVSPQDMQPSGFEYHNGNGTLCLIGSYDEATGTFSEEKDQAIDYGIDFYAPQTVLTEDGRRIMIGWMQNWDACAIRNPSEQWAGQMSVPRELSLKDGRLYEQPVRELIDMYQDTVIYKDVVIGTGESVALEGVRGRCVDMTIHVRPADPGHVFHRFSVRFAQKDRLRTAVSFRPHEKSVKVDRKYSGSCRAFVHQRRCLVEGSSDGVITLRLVLDRFSAEVFINDGRYVMSAAIFTDLAAEGISFFADGEAVIDVESHRLS